MRDSRTIQSVASLVILGAGGVLALLWHGGFSPGSDARRHQAAGWGLAQQAVRLVKPGGQVTVIVRDTAAFRDPAGEILLASLRKELRLARVPIGTVHALQVDPLRPLEVSAGDFQELIRRAPKGSVIVSCMGPPWLSAAQRQRLGEIKPAIVAFCPGTSPGRIDFRTLFDEGLLHAAIVSRTVPPGQIPDSPGVKERFEQLFKTLTAGGAADAL